MLCKVIIASFLLVLGFCRECRELKTEAGKVCICDSKYCDSIEKLTLSPGSYQIYTTSEKKLGFSSSLGELLENQHAAAENYISVNPETTYQTIVGFGGAFTDSTGISVNALPKRAQKLLLNSLFGDDGVRYSLCRVPIAGTDFSKRQYTYADDYGNDLEMTHFKLQPEDTDIKIPLIKKALELTRNQLELFASSWTVPAWMKTNNFTGVTMLKEEFYQAWANYYLRFFEEYSKQGIHFWGMTTQNEPLDGIYPFFAQGLNWLGFYPHQMNKWVGNYLGPTIRNSPFRYLKIMLHDDNRFTLPFLPLQLENDETIKYADGVAIHFYWDTYYPNSFLEYTKSSKKDLFLLATEACYGPVSIGNWTRAEGYIESIIFDLQHDSVGWVDWNMVLNENGGPTLLNPLDAAIMINSTSGQFYKLPIYYALGHFSKFIRPGSVRIETTFLHRTANVNAIAFKRPDNVIAVIFYNGGPSETTIHITTHQGDIVHIIQSKSINTILFQ